MTESVLTVSTFQNCFLGPPERVEGGKSLYFGCNEGISNDFDIQTCNQTFTIGFEIKKAEDETQL